MSSRMLDACLLTFALLLVSCAQAPGDAAQSAAAHEAGVDPALDAPQEEVPPATVPGAARALAPLAADFSGFGPVPFGSDAQALRLAWGGPLEGGGGDEPGSVGTHERARPLCVPQGRAHQAARAQGQPYRRALAAPLAAH